MAVEVAEDEASAVHEQHHRQALLRMRAIDADADVASGTGDGAVDHLRHRCRLEPRRFGLAHAQQLDRNLAERRRRLGHGEQGSELRVDGHIQEPQ